MDRSLHGIEEYERLVGAEAVERVAAKAERLKDARIVHFNSTFYGGGVAELLSSMTLLMACAGIKVEWRVIQGSPDFFNVTKKMHNALQGGCINLSDRKLDVYESTVLHNALRNPLDHDMVVVHDPQPLPLIRHYHKKAPWVWRCHVDLSNPHPGLWNYLKDTVELYDAVILSIREYAQKLLTPQVFFMPAIDPFDLKNKKLSEHEINERLHRYKIPTDLPIVAQVSRFDRWKDPEGVIEAFKIARKHVDATLVLLGNVATDDPEGVQVYESLLGNRDERIIILSVQDSALVNALQRKAAVVLQKSIREGFGLTVAEAMWKGTPVIGGNVGGIRYQIDDRVNGFLVDSAQEAAERIVYLLRHLDKAREMGIRAREKVRDNFLLLRNMEQYLDLYASFEPHFVLGEYHGPIVRGE